MRTVYPVLDHDGKQYGLPSVLVSDSPRPQIAREENEMLAMFGVNSAFLEMKKALHPMRPQEVFLRVLTAVVTAQYGKRDEDAEHKTAVRFIQWAGLKDFYPPERS